MHKKILILLVAIVSKFDLTRGEESEKEFIEKNILKSQIGPFPDDQNRHLFVFTQITDIHLSEYFETETRLPNFLRFCKEVVPIVKPSLVLATGDLTDNLKPDFLGSQQNENEWKMYQRAVNESGVTNLTTWLDIRGNHDFFNTMTSSDPQNFYRRYSIQHQERSYRHVVHHDTETYTFIGMDACVEPGPKRPLNFIGLLNETDMKVLNQMKLDAQSTSNYTIWFGHYPTSSIFSPSPGVRTLMRHSGPYLCGHFHTLMGFVPAMYALQDTGAIELELADFMGAKRFRVLAIDHDILSFEDFNLGDWPLVVVTNPKAALFTMPSIEPLGRIRNSSHIRVLVFNPYSIEEIQLRIDGGAWSQMNQTSSEGPLFTLPWQPHLYSQGLHTIELKVKDTAGNSAFKQHVFSLDGSRPPFSAGGRFAITGHITFFRYIFIASFLLAMFPFCLFRLLSIWKKDGYLGDPFSNWLIVRWVFKIYLFVNVDIIFWPLAILALYLTCGPLFVGALVSGHIGVSFSWGIYLNGTLLPGAFSFLLAAIYFQLFFLPTVLLLCHEVYLRWLQTCAAIPEKRLSFSSVFYWLCCAFLVMWHLILEVGLVLTYGFMAAALGFGVTWAFLVMVFLWWKAHTLQENHFSRILENSPSLISNSDRISLKEKFPSSYAPQASSL